MSSEFTRAVANCRGRPTRPLIAAMLALCVSWAGISHADLPSDLGHGPTSAKVSLPPSKHWIWINDFVFPHMVDGMVYLIDGDSGRYLGTLSTGFGFAHVVPSPDGTLLYSPETYFSRGTRGKSRDAQGSRKGRMGFRRIHPTARATVRAQEFGEFDPDLERFASFAVRDLHG